MWVNQLNQRVSLHVVVSPFCRGLHHSYLFRVATKHVKLYNIQRVRSVGCEGGGKRNRCVLLLWSRCHAYTTIFSLIHPQRSRIILIRVRTHNNNNGSAAVTTVTTHLHTASESKIFCIQSHTYSREFNTEFAAVLMCACVCCRRNLPPSLPLLLLL